MILENSIIPINRDLYTYHVDGIWLPALLRNCSPDASYITANSPLEGLLVSDLDLVLKMSRSLLSCFSSIILYKLIKDYSGTYYLSPINQDGISIPGGFNIKLLEVKYV